MDAPIASAVVEVDGGEIAVEHQITDLREGGGGRATAPCSSTAARQWSFPWGVTARGARELLVFMNPFPDDATVDVLLATDQGTREPRRLQNLVVRGRSALGVFIDQDTRRDHVVRARGRRTGAASSSTASRPSTARTRPTRASPSAWAPRRRPRCGSTPTV